MAQFTQTDRQALNDRLQKTDNAWRSLGPTYPTWYFDVLSRLLLLSDGQQIDYLTSEAKGFNTPFEAQVVAFTAELVICCGVRIEGAEDPNITARAFPRSEFNGVEILDAGIYSSDVPDEMPRSLKVTSMREQLIVPLGNGSRGEPLAELLASIINDLRKAS